MISVDAFFDELEKIALGKGAGIGEELIGRAKYLFGAGKATPGMRAAKSGVFGKAVGDVVEEAAGRGSYMAGAGKTTSGMRKAKVGPISPKGLRG